MEFGCEVDAYKIILKVKTKNPTQVKTIFTEEGGGEGSLDDCIYDFSVCSYCQRTYMTENDCGYCVANKIFEK